MMPSASEPEITISTIALFISAVSILVSFLGILINFIHNNRNFKSTFIPPLRIRFKHIPKAEYYLSIKNLSKDISVEAVDIHIYLKRKRWIFFKKQLFCFALITKVIPPQEEINSDDPNAITLFTTMEPIINRIHSAFKADNKKNLFEEMNQNKIFLEGIAKYKPGVDNIHPIKIKFKRFFKVTNSEEIQIVEYSTRGLDKRLLK